jgi:tetratricopeptide (TPR) repeat protein
VPDLTLAGQLALGRACLDAGEHVQAQQIAERILATYPRCIDARLLLGLAALGAGRDDDAARCFRRVLGADPERAEAHAGLGAHFALRGAPLEAIGHLQRSLDLDAGQLQVRRELRRLLQRSDATVGRIPMTIAGLARARMNGYLFESAVPLLEEALGAEPDRADLQAAFATALWQMGDEERATRVAAALHERLPYCLVANLILGRAWLGGERDAEARECLQRAQEVDPSNARARALFGQRSPLPPRAPRLPLEDDGSPRPEDDQPYLAAEDAEAPSPEDVRGAPTASPD